MLQHESSTNHTLEVGILQEGKLKGAWFMGKPYAWVACKTNDSPTTVTLLYTPATVALLSATKNEIDKKCS